MRAQFLRFFLLKDVLFARGCTKEKMTIFQSNNLQSFNNHENNVAQRSISEVASVKGILKDIAENLYLILISLVPLIFYPIFYHHCIDNEYNYVSGIVSNPDLMLLPIPFLMHCVLLVSSRGGLQLKKAIVAWDSLVIILSILFYLLLKLNNVMLWRVQVTIIWVIMGMSLVSGIIGNLMAFFKKGEKK